MTPALLALAVLVAAPGAKDPPKKDAPSVVGEWVAESAVERGRPLKPPPGTTWGFTSDGKSVLTLGGRDPAEGTYKADAGKAPAELDVSAGPTGKPLKAIYKVDGDTLTVALVDGDGDRPAAFESPAGSRVILMVLKRTPKKE
jgi:uncharacterized protein (TIGR03067 family)